MNTVEFFQVTEQPVRPYLGIYSLLKLLGRGGFATVYLGQHRYLGTLAAIKVLRTRLAQNEWQRFLSEARLTAHLAHAHIVKVLDFGVENGLAFLVMRYATHTTYTWLAAC
jgi:serine/threonine-protein kinase